MQLATRTLLLFALASPVLCAGGDFDFKKLYGGKLDYVEGALGQSWTAHLDDVWELSGFEYRMKGELEIELGPSTVVIGKNESGKLGKSAVWAAVIPHDPEAGKPIISSSAGHRNTVSSMFLRFHPGEISKLFPKKTIQGPGDPLQLIWGKRLYDSKINAGWQAENMPVVPWKHAMVMDVATVQGKRRYYSIDTKKKSVQYVDAFEKRLAPAVPQDAVEAHEAVGAFDKAWAAFDKDYAMFAIKPDVDWAALRETYRPVAATATTAFEAAGVIGLLVNHLEDLHVYVKLDGRWVSGFNRMRMLNANYQWLKAQLQGTQEVPKKVTWGRADDDIGYIAIWNLEADGLVEVFDAALESLADTKGMIVDLRFNGGGNEKLGRSMAGRFLLEEATYSYSQYRNGGKHSDLGEKLARTVEPRGPWTYEAPITVLIGQKTMSSAESFALMLAQAPGATTFGDRTAGSSANPKLVDAGLGITVLLSQWIDLDDKGEPIDAVGILPAKPVEASSYDDFRETDPVFEAALKHAKKNRAKKPGKRD